VLQENQILILQSSKKLNSKSVGNLANIVLTNFVLKRPYKLSDQPKIERIKNYVGTKT